MLVIAIIALQILFNLVNSRVDAYRIFKTKSIAHGINFGCYAALVGAECWYLQSSVLMTVIMCIQAFLNRQNWFDIPLNMRRRKHDKTITWDYQSRAKPPKAITDRIEYWIFGYNPAAIAITYMVLWVASLITLYILIK